MEYCNLYRSSIQWQRHEAIILIPAGLLDSFDFDAEERNSWLRMENLSLITKFTICVWQWGWTTATSGRSTRRDWSKLDNKPSIMMRLSRAIDIREDRIIVRKVSDMYRVNRGNERVCVCEWEHELGVEKLLQTKSIKRAVKVYLHLMRFWGLLFHYWMGWITWNAHNAIATIIHRSPLYISV